MIDLKTRLSVDVTALDCKILKDQADRATKGAGTAERAAELAMCNARAAQRAFVIAKFNLDLAQGLADGEPRDVESEYKAEFDRCAARYIERSPGVKPILSSELKPLVDVLSGDEAK